MADRRAETASPPHVYGWGWGEKREAAVSQTRALVRERSALSPTRADSAEGRRPSTGPEMRSAQRGGPRLRGVKSQAAGGRKRGV
jgi:hypothetical protein